ncbi:MAG TPA: poly(R)-hydroxyalkanoic acid synthase subunit PhaE [Dissulfurispiraceae bacterium]|nr:poly(R)-hydroxyalkanoic acid synthase subunit PhaE [Dissulfurispiraceae bacterium]
MKKAMDFFDTWVKSQEKLVENWMETTKKLPQTLRGMETFKNNRSDPSGSGFVDLYTSWVNEMISALAKMHGLNTDIIKDTLSKVTDGSDVYVRFYKIWLPIFQAIQERVADPDIYRELIDPIQYKEVVDRIFGFSPDAVTEFLDQASKLSESWGFVAKEFGGPWMKAARKNTAIAPEFVEGRPETFLNIFHNLFCAFDNTIGKVFHIPAVGKDREKVELIMRGCDDLAVFLARNTEYQHMVYVTAVKAMDKVVETVAQKITNGEEIKTFDEFFDLWLDINEREYYDLFRTEEFSKMQGELLDSSLNVRKHFHKLMELYLFDFPVALRSEMDDLYRTVYDLRKKVGYLEEKLNGVTEKEAAV